MDGTWIETGEGRVIQAEACGPSRPQIVDYDIQKAKEPGAVTMRALDICADGSVRPSRGDIVTAKPVYEAKVEAELGAEPGRFGEPDWLCQVHTPRSMPIKKRSFIIYIHIKFDLSSSVGKRSIHSRGITIWISGFD